jgi:glycosyltransferase involved in cell wall biosynthesis
VKIAQVSPLHESVPPRFYGGTERIVSYLTEELVRLGHSVTLFASGDSETSAELHPIVSRALRQTPGIRDSHVFSLLQFEALRARASEFDVIHFHTEYLHFPLCRELGLHNAVSTLHGRLDLPGYGALFDHYRDIPLVSISNSQRRPQLKAHWLGTVAHGLPNAVCRFERVPRGDYLAFVGRLSPEKRPDRAIEIARRAGMKIKIAAKIDTADREYYETHVKALLAQPHVEYVGEIGERDKCEFLGHARALLFPIDWPEPFGLVMIEAMSCGTPCVAWNAGSVPEIISEGSNGFIVDTIDDAVAAVHRATQLDRAAVRASFDQRFTVERMTHDYLDIYRRVAERRGGRVAA